MGLVSLVYRSQFSRKLSVTGDLRQILKSAQTNNAAAHVTGMLIFGNQWFLQALEGDAERVNQIYHRIVADERHRCPELVSYGEIESRRFGRWAMTLADTAELGSQELLRHGPEPVFNPSLMSPASSMALLSIVADRHNVKAAA